MRREYHKWFSSNLGREMELLVFGHAGDPILFFPTRTARFFDYEDWQVIDALRKKIETGAIQVYCLDSVDRESLYSRDIHPAERVLRHLQYEKYVLEEVMDMLIQTQNPHPTIVAAGCSLGAFHAANLAFKHPHRFHKMVGLSGRYDLTTSMEHFDDLFDGYRDETIYFNMPGLFIPYLDDPQIIAQLKMEIIFVVGEHDVFLENNRNISNALWAKGIWNALHLWDGESHKARYWRHMVQLYL